MSEIKRVKIQSIVESQIPEFLNNDSPLFKEFLEQYYISQEHQTGIVDLAENIQKYKNIDNFNQETFYTKEIPCILTQDVSSFGDTIYVNHTIGFPQKYGLLKIENEIITYTGITTNSFTGCIRGFSGLDKNRNDEYFSFSSTSSTQHNKIVDGNPNQVINLNLLFFNEIFKKFKYQFLPGFEDREFTKGIDLKSILLKAKDFYISKGTDISYKILFSILFGEEVEVLKPQEYMLRPSDNDYLVTKNILVKKIDRDSSIAINTIDLRNQLRGKTAFQKLSNGNIASSSIYNIEYRPIDNEDFYEISLDSSSFVFDFEATKKTNLSENVTLGSNTILVDSTVGFPKSGSLVVRTSKLSNIITLNYTDKSLTEFINVSGVIADLELNDELLEDNFLYCFLDDGTKIEFGITNVISDVDISNTSNLRVGDKIQLSTFGFDLNDRSEFNCWNYNVPTTHKIKYIDFDNRIYFHDTLFLVLGDKLLLSNPDDSNDSSIEITVSSHGISSGGYYIEIEEKGLNISNKKEAQRIIRKSNSYLNYFPNISNLKCGIQNTYVDYDLNNFYVSSSGLPNYTIFSSENKKYVTTSGITSIFYCSNHNLYTGEKIYYSPSSSQSGIKTSVYFVRKVDDNNIKISYSQSDLYSNNYIESKNSSFGDFIVKDFYNGKTLNHQKLFKKFNLNKNELYFDDPEKRKTRNKKIGILVNGVELLSNTTFNDNIYYGKISSIDIKAPGKNYDVINFSGISIEDDSGLNAKVNGCVTGSLKEVKLLSFGIGYQIKPKITLNGGNGSGAVIESNLVKQKINLNFNPSDIVDNKINFSQNHNLEPFEELIYTNNSNVSISPLKNESSYFVGVTSSTQIQLYETKNNALSGINTISISGIGYSGLHNLKTLKSKNTITKIYVKNGGKGYSNRFISIPSILSGDNKTNGINTFDDYIFAKNHNFKNEDLVEYSTTGNPISGLSTTNSYYVTVIDGNKFKLSDAGIGENPTKSNYFKKKYVSFGSIGQGIHKFSYPKIKINIESMSGVSTTIIEPTLDPIVLGSIDNIFIENGGSNYGTPDILNFHRRPFISVKKESSVCRLIPTILNGSIVDVQILSSGDGYFNDIDLLVTSKSGKYAELYPIIENGKIVKILVTNPGVGYNPQNTTIIIRKRGSGAQFEGNIFEWRINQIEKNKLNINQLDDGILIPNENDDLGLQFVHYYPPKKLRQIVNNFINATGEKIGQEDPPTGSTNPYQILGWAYDGNPIFGPYGKVNERIERLKTSYVKITNDEVLKSINDRIRPNFNNGFFANDYIFDLSKSNGDLDEYNGIFINDSKFPNINYGYVFTIDENGNPQYPYVTGEFFKNIPLEENYDPRHNQDLDINKLNIVRNTGPYYLNSPNSSYKLINRIKSKYKQEFIVKEIESSGINSISVYSPGENYRVGDNLNFDDFSSGGNGISASVSKIKGKEITDIQIGISTFSNVTIIPEGSRIKVITNSPHNLVSGDEVTVKSISSSEYNYIQGSKKISVKQKTTGLLVDIPNQATTGVTTYIEVSDISGFQVDDLIQIGQEKLKIIDILPSESRLIVNRYDNYTGIHSSGVSLISLLPTSFIFDADSYDDTIEENKTRYFNPTNSIGFGTTGTNYYKFVGIKTDLGNVNAAISSYVGINTTGIKIGDYISGNYIQNDTKVTSIGIGSVQISPQHTLGGGVSVSTISVKRLIHDKFVPPRAIYMPSHRYYTGQSLTYNVGLGGTGIVVSDTGVGSTFKLNQNQTIYMINLGTDYVGISTLGFTTTSGIGSSLNSLYFSNQESSAGLAHSFTTQYHKVTASFENYSAIVSTAQTHGLTTGDSIRFNALPSFTETIKIRYDKKLRKITSDLIGFDSNLGVNTSTNEITLVGNTLKTGDKIVYYSNGDAAIGGLVDNKTYYVLKQDPDKIKLSNYSYDASVGVSITFTSVGLSTHYISLINPPILLEKGNILKFDLTDSSVSEMELKLYKDSNFRIELENFKYTKNNKKEIDSINSSYPIELYYNLIPKNENSIELQQISSDNEVIGNNKIKISNSNLNQEYSIIGIGATTFKFNLKTKSKNISYNKNSESPQVYYTTNSKTSIGPIEKVKLNYGGRGYKKLPKISSIDTQYGKNSILSASSQKIGKIQNLELVKNGFNYPTDTTLNPILSSPSIVEVGDIMRVDYINILSGGRNYNNAPSLKVIGNDNIKLTAKVQGGSVVGVDIVKNTNNLSTPMRIVSTNNSNGYEIENIVVENETTIKLELLNNSQTYPLIAIGYGKTESVFPFSIGDEIFVENCRKNANYPTDSFNSKDYNYRFFKVTQVDPENNTVTFDMSDIGTGFTFKKPDGDANYTTSFGYGSVVNKKDMAQFEMILIDDLVYISGEKVIGVDGLGNQVFSAIVMENGWDNDINQLRLIDVSGNLKRCEKIKGEKSLLNGTVKSINEFNLKTSLSATREKTNSPKNEIGFLNNYHQRLSDNNYYQRFSYSLRGKIPHNEWREPVKSIIHPAGFKEFSDLNVVSVPSNKNLKVGIANSSLSILVNIQSGSSMSTKNNFSLSSENENNLFEESIERITIGAEKAHIAGIGETGPVYGIPLKTYTLSKTNKVLMIDNISDEFDGSNDYITIANRSSTFNSFYPYYVGIDTSNINAGDYIGISPYLDSENTIITKVGINSVEINIPHTVDNGVETSIVNIRRKLPGNSVVGRKSFDLKNNGVPLFYHEFEGSNSNIINLNTNTIEIKNHNFQTGQRIIYNQKTFDTIKVGVASTSVDDNFSYDVNMKFDDNIWFSFDMSTVKFNPS